jgi:hypothetical protein
VESLGQPAAKVDSNSLPIHLSVLALLSLMKAFQTSKPRHVGDRPVLRACAPQSHGTDLGLPNRTDSLVHDESGLTCLSGWKTFSAVQNNIQVLTNRSYH